MTGVVAALVEQRAAEKAAAKPVTVEEKNSVISRIFTEFLEQRGDESREAIHQLDKLLDETREVSRAQKARAHVGYARQHVAEFLRAAENIRDAKPHGQNRLGEDAQLLKNTVYQIDLVEKGDLQGEQALRLGRAREFIHSAEEDLRGQLREQGITSADIDALNVANRDKLAAKENRSPLEKVKEFHADHSEHLQSAARLLDKIAANAEAYDKPWLIMHKPFLHDTAQYYRRLDAGLKAVAEERELTSEQYRAVTSYVEVERNLNQPSQANEPAFRFDLKEKFERKGIQDGHQKRLGHAFSNVVSNQSGVTGYLGTDPYLMKLKTELQDAFPGIWDHVIIASDERLPTPLELRSEINRQTQEREKSGIAARREQITAEARPQHAAEERLVLPSEKITDVNLVLTPEAAAASAASGVNLKAILGRIPGSRGAIQPMPPGSRGASRGR